MAENALPSDQSIRSADVAAAWAAAASVPRKHLFVTHSAAPAGAEMSLMELVHHLPGYNKVLFLQEGPLTTRFCEQGIATEVWPMPAKAARIRRESGIGAALSSAPHLALLLMRLAREFRRHELVVAWSQKAFALSAMAAVVARRPLVWSLHDMLTPDHFSKGMRRLAVGVANATGAKVITISHAAADAFVQAGGRARPRCVHRGIDPVPFTRLDAETVRRQRLGLAAEGKFLLGSFSRLAPWKGQHVVIEALVRAPSVHAVFVGAPLFGDEAYEGHLRQLAMELGVAERVRFLGHRPDVPALMAACDAVVHSSVAPEPSGRVVIEGMLTGQPVVATAAGGVPEYLRNEEHGLLVPPGDPEALGAALRRLAANPQLRRKLGERARAHALQQFTIKRSVQGYAAVFQAVLGGSGRSPRPLDDAAQL